MKAKEANKKVVFKEKKKLKEGLVNEEERDAKDLIDT